MYLVKWIVLGFELTELTGVCSLASALTQHNKVINSTFFQDKADWMRAHEGRQLRQNERCETPLGASHRSGGTAADDSHVIQSNAQKRKESVL